MKTSDFDKKFDDGKDITAFLDLKNATRVGVTRQSLIKLWLADKLERLH